MVREKILAAAGLQLLTGALGTSSHRVAAKTVGHYRGQAKANRKRLQLRR